jgi:hypothetical protein
VFPRSASGIYLGGHGNTLNNANENVVARNTIAFGSDCYQVRLGSDRTTVLAHSGAAVS